MNDAIISMMQRSNSQTLVVCSLKDRCFAATKVMGLKEIVMIFLKIRDVIFSIGIL